MIIPDIEEEDRLVSIGSRDGIYSIKIGWIFQLKNQYGIKEVSREGGCETGVFL